MTEEGGRGSDSGLLRRSRVAGLCARRHACHLVHTWQPTVSIKLRIVKQPRISDQQDFLDGVYPPY